MIVEDSATALAYLWATTPVLGMEALPIYADDEFKLPGAPWWISFNESNKIHVSYNWNRCMYLIAIEWRLLKT